METDWGIERMLVRVMMVFWSSFGRAWIFWLSVALENSWLACMVPMAPMVVEM